MNFFTFPSDRVMCWIVTVTLIGANIGGIRVDAQIIGGFMGAALALVQPANRRRGNMRTFSRQNTKKKNDASDE